MRWIPRPGEVVAVYDRRLTRWRSAIVVHVNLLQWLFTARAGSVWFAEETVHPKIIRPVRLVYCRRCSERRQAGRAA